MANGRCVKVFPEIRHKPLNGFVPWGKKTLPFPFLDKSEV